MGSALAFVGLTGILNLLRRTMMPVAEISYSYSPMLSFIVVVAVSMAGAAFLLDVFTIFKKKERSFMVYFTTQFRLFVLLMQELLPWSTDV